VDQTLLRNIDRGKRLFLQRVSVEERYTVEGGRKKGRVGDMGGKGRDGWKIIFKRVIMKGIDFV